MTEIGAAAFASCASLEYIYLPAGLTSIGDSAFSGCTSLSSVTFLGLAPPTFGSNAFQNVPNGITVNVPPGTLADYQTALGSLLPGVQWVEAADITADFTDPAFLAALRSWLGKDPSDPIYTTDVSNLTELDVSGADITSLAGIEHFTALQWLYCSDNQLVSLDVRQNTALQDLYCNNNRLTSLTLDQNTGLLILNCANNPLSALDISACADSLYYLFFNGCSLSDTATNALLAQLPDRAQVELAYTHGGLHVFEAASDWYMHPFRFTVNSDLVATFWNYAPASGLESMDLYDIEDPEEPEEPVDSETLSLDLRAPAGYSLPDMSLWERTGIDSIDNDGPDSYILALSGGNEASLRIALVSGGPGGNSGGSDDPGGNSGGTGGGAGSSTATTGSSSSSSRDRTRVDHTASSAVSWLSQNQADTLANNAKENGQDYARTSSTGAFGVRAAVLKAFAGLRYRHDTIADGVVQVRLTIDTPENIAKDVLVSGYVKGSDVDSTRSLFEKWFGNKVQAIHMDQQEDWGQPVKIATKIDLTGMDTENLYFYSFDKQTNTYRRIENPAYWIDANGYLHFTTEYAGDIIISEGLLEPKGQN